MTRPRYLTKSRFRLACECPAKLYYTGKSRIYANAKMDDPFLLELADGGYQVGELAKYYYSGGHNIDTLDYDASLRQTKALMQQEEATIYEAAFRYHSLYIRVDILLKRGDRIDLIEVKAKSFDTNDLDVFMNQRDGGLSGNWQAYLYDVAFQKHVLAHVYPEHDINAYLLLVDKNARCPVDGLNREIRVIKDDNDRRTVQVRSGFSGDSIAQQMLCKIPVDRYCDMIFNNEDAKEPYPLGFVDRVNLYADKYAKDIRIFTPISSACAACEFKTDGSNGLQSGFRECWSGQLGWKDKDFLKPTILDLWDNRNKDKHLVQGKARLLDLDETDISVKEDGRPGVSRSQRQWLQVEKAKNNDSSLWLDATGLRQEMSTWKFPLHFIDFETATPALPFNKGRRPYEGIAFQFSHHVVYKDGRVEHVGQYLNTKPGMFPNYEFVRALKSELSTDDGSIFRYASHENTYLNIIHSQLQDDESEIPDREELCAFIEAITYQKNEKNQVIRRGERDMIDMLHLVKRYYFDPLTGGSNSIKQVLPSILNRSPWLQEKYAQSIYGANKDIPSLNFPAWTWVRFEGGHLVDPYSLLPKMFQDSSKHDMELFSKEEELKEGGAATTAYARMQFEEMSDYERNEIENALLKYCELDTLAMVLIYEGWREML